MRSLGHGGKLNTNTLLPPLHHHIIKAVGSEAPASTFIAHQSQVDFQNPGQKYGGPHIAPHCTPETTLEL